jgi:hypothetical protein
VTVRGIPGGFRSLAAAGVLVVGLGTALGACGDNGTSLAKQACTHVNLSISLLHESAARTDPAEATELRDRAYLQLVAALPIAAQAAGQDAEWQALMTTLSEAGRVPEGTLVDALTQQCQVADSSTFNQAPPPSSIPPPDVGTSP